jgi:hypothetical protein
MTLLLYNSKDVEQIAVNAFMTNACQANHREPSLSSDVSCKRVQITGANQSFYPAKRKKKEKITSIFGTEFSQRNNFLSIANCLSRTVLLRKTLFISLKRGFCFCYSGNVIRVKKLSHPFTFLK